jgi:hypothetical protein
VEKPGANPGIPLWFKVTFGDADGAGQTPASERQCSLAQVYWLELLSNHVRQAENNYRLASRKMAMLGSGLFIDSWP